MKWAYVAAELAGWSSFVWVSWGFGRTEGASCGGRGRMVR
ncbi:hypothetical protein SCATT_p07250 (plasmid) [Streptantibioticus cattleyicolor NRRL 8057 = DSM 46488]|uniref:Uncharacterized protein n=1 Tax=Streptantibioticus cattleyicolor (strain ATCC 35852 / DSM 46488 / JCM 4925 / NBRC 14057 / NRRL 8057) TaxID=1003195 RepID=G8XHQ3_STREN|nr:hypothetical protein SCATT_p07250 [Streptantibioticus cattleyicolor NRRL 8057 = DSM 46488]